MVAAFALGSAAMVSLRVGTAVASGPRARAPHVGFAQRQHVHVHARGHVIHGAIGAAGADVVDVVTAVAESEAALNTLVAVRDRVIQAYEEIMRMPI